MTPEPNLTPVDMGTYWLIGDCRCYTLDGQIHPNAPAAIAQKFATTVDLPPAWGKAPRKRSADGLRYMKQAQPERPAVEPGPTRVKRRAPGAGRPTADRERIIALHREGRSDTEIAAALGLAVLTIKRKLAGRRSYYPPKVAAARKPRKPSPPTVYAEDIVTEAATLRMQGLSNIAIGERMGYHRNQIGEMLKQYPDQERLKVKRCLREYRDGGWRCKRGHLLKGAGDCRQCRRLRETELRREQGILPKKRVAANPETAETIRRMKREGATAREIAEALGTTPKSIRHALNCLGICKRRPRAGTLERRERMMEMHNQGESHDVIARIMGYAVKTVDNLVYQELRKAVTPCP